MMRFNGNWHMKTDPKAKRKIPIPQAFGSEPVVVDLTDLAEFKAKFGLRTVAAEWPRGAARPTLYVETITLEKE